MGKAFHICSIHHSSSLSTEFPLFSSGCSAQGLGLISVLHAAFIWLRVLSLIQHPPEKITHLHDCPYSFHSFHFLLQFRHHSACYLWIGRSDFPVSYRSYPSLQTMFIIVFPAEYFFLNMFRRFVPS